MGPQFTLPTEALGYIYVFMNKHIFHIGSEEASGEGSDKVLVSE